MTRATFRTRDVIFTSSLLFGLFFGSGNLIFPVSLGQSAGNNFWLAIMGLLISAVGLPLLGVCAIGLTQSGGVLDLSSRVGHHFGRIFTCILYLVIGPLLILPRLADTAFVMSFGTAIAAKQQPYYLLLFSILFLGISYWFSRRPTNLLTLIGKVLNPVFLGILAIILGAGLLFPMGDYHVMPTGPYRTHPISVGFEIGYNTMDLLAALAFGIIIIASLQERGIIEPRALTRATIRAGILSSALMSAIYIALAFVGAGSAARFGVQSNGGLALAQIAQYYFGSAGQVILGLLVILACLKTAVGLISSFGETYHDLYPSWPYQVIIVVVSVVALLVANIGLDQIIVLSKPFLMFIYPLAITLVLCAVTTSFVRGPHRWSYRLAIVMVMIPALLSGLLAIPNETLQATYLFQQLDWFFSLIPFADYGLEWVLPAILGMMFGLLLDNNSDEEVD